jgi:2'-5' RNA ligase
MPDVLSWRLFIALAVPDHVREELTRAQRGLREALSSGIRWTPPEQFHLTLKFLGDVPADSAKRLEERLRNAVEILPVGQLHSGGLGVFPDLRRPRVIWAGAASADNQLAVLHKAVQLACAEFSNEPAENEFAGHITLGRVKKPDRALCEAIGRAVKMGERRAFGTWTAKSVDLMRSELSESGAKHLIQASFLLFGASTDRDE